MELVTCEWYMRVIGDTGGRCWGMIRSGIIVGGGLMIQVVGGGEGLQHAA